MAFLPVLPDLAPSRRLTSESSSRCASRQLAPGTVDLDDAALQHAFAGVPV